LENEILKKIVKDKVPAIRCIGYAGSEKSFYSECNIFIKVSKIKEK